MTIISFCGISYYEIGFCRYFGIPTDYISIELTKYSFLLFAFLATLFLSAMVFDPIFSHFNAILRIKNRVLRALVSILFLSVLLFVFWDYLKFLRLQETLYLVVTILFGLVLILNAKRKDSDYGILDPKYSINIILSQQVGRILGPMSIMAAVICSLLFCLGYLTAQNQKIFFTKPDNKTLLLKKYGETVIYGHYENNRFTSILVERNISSVDSLYFIKIK